MRPLLPSSVAVGLLVVGLLVAPPGPACGADDTGARVRITILARVPADSIATFGVTPGERIAGAWQGARPGVLALRRGDAPADTLLVPRALVASFELGRGRHGHARRGMVIGTLVGAAAGLAFGQWFTEDESIGATQGQGAWVGAFGLGGALGGMGLGALVGSLVRAETWTPAPLPPDPPTTSPAPDR